MRIRIAAFALVLALAGSSGCMAVRLKQRTMHQASTLPELQYQQVLNNLAMFADNPAALPWHVNFREGTTQVTDSASAGAAVDLGPPAETLPQLFGSRTIVVQWGMTPVIDATELRLLRIAYRRTIGSPEMPDPEFLAELAHELKNQFPSNADQRDESELFYEIANEESATSPNSTPGSRRPMTRRSATVPRPWHRRVRRWRRTSAASSTSSSATWPGSGPAGSTSAASGTFRGARATSATTAVGTSGSVPRGARP